MQYKAPLRDIKFVMHELLDSESHYKTLPAFQEADRELMDSLFEMAASFAENEQQRDFLLAMGCQYGQGYWFGKPMTAEAATELLMQQHLSKNKHD